MKSQKVLIFLCYTQLPLCMGWRATLYAEDIHNGSSLAISGNRMSEESCVDLGGRELCDTSTCLAAEDRANSVNTHGTCIRVYRHNNCQRAVALELRPGTLCHVYWGNCGIGNDIRSVGGCPHNDDILEFVNAVSIESGRITSPKHPQNYDSNIRKAWVTTVPFGYQIRMTFEAFDLEPESSGSDTCRYDSLLIKELVSEKVIFRGCGSSAPSIVISESNQVYIQLTTDSTVTSSGFSLFWERYKNDSRPDAIPNVQFYENSHFEDLLVTYKLPGTGCYNYPPSKVESIDTGDRCIQIFTGSDCTGEHLRLYPGGPHYHTDLPPLFKNNVNTIASCMFKTGNPGVVPNRKIKIENLNMTNFQVFDPRNLSVATYPDLWMVTFRRSEPDQPLDGTTVIFRNDKKVVVYIHGYATSDLIDGVEMKNAIFKGTDDVDSVILLDWRHWSLPDYDDSYDWWPPNYSKVAKFNVPLISGHLMDFLKKRIGKDTNLHIVGFSLGAHIAGTAARELAKNGGRKISRISGLDPAGPIFEYSLGIYDIDTTNTLRVTDAVFVDVVHASTVLGMVNAAGIIDFRIKEVECTLPSCTHHKAVDVFIASLTTCSLVTCPVELLILNSYGYFVCNTIDSNHLSSVGYLAGSYVGRGFHEVPLYMIYTDGLGDHNIPTGSCTTFMNLELPAKKRICHGRPNDASTCENKPYLSTCIVSCPSSTRISECSANGLSLIPPVQPLTSTNESNAQTLTKVGVGWTRIEDCPVPASCRTESFGQVPYFVAYKHPKTNNYHMVYPGATTPLRSTLLATSPHSLFAQTLKPIYRHSPNPMNFIMWNDGVSSSSLHPTDSNASLVLGWTNLSSREEIPVEPLATYGHSKGVLGFNGEGGFLLLHSVPNYPPRKHDGYTYPNSGKDNAQVAICISLQGGTVSMTEVLTKLLTDMALFKPNVYDTWVGLSVPDSIKEATEKLTERRKMPRQPLPTYSHFPLGQFTVHVTGRTIEPQAEDAFERLADHYRTNLLAQTWKDNKVGRLPSTSCLRTFTVENIENIKIGSDSWSHKVDHSKWGVSKTPTGVGNGALCIGDLNRATSTMSRGGMFICTNQANLVSIFRNFIGPGDIEECKSTILSGTSRNFSESNLGWD